MAKGQTLLRHYTLGCKLNQVESEIIAEAWRQEAEGRTSDEVVYINSCAVTTAAAAKSRHAIARIARRHPGAVIVVGGCLAQAEPDRVAAIPGVRHVLGTQARFHTARWAGAQRPVLDTSSTANTQLKVSSGSPNRARPLLKIQDGCEQNCSFCIIPSLRGGQRSAARSDIIAEASRLNASGAREIVLTGVRIGAWGTDLNEPASLLALVQDLLSSGEGFRIRLGSLEPWEFGEEWVELMGKEARLCNHIHLPIQHTHAAVLNRMGRPELGRLIDRLKRLPEIIPDVCIGLDVIAGFPGESELEFQHLYDTLATLPVGNLHVFGFSPRPNTPAAAMKGQLPAKVIKQRVTRLIALGNDLKRRFERSQVGKVRTVIADYNRGNANLVNAVSDNYLRVRIPAEIGVGGRLQQVRIDRGLSGELTGLPV